MAASCCGAKKQKLNSATVASAAANSSSMNSPGNASNHCNGILSNGLPGGASGSSSTVSKGVIVASAAEAQLASGGRQRVVTAEMVVYCFDVLYSYLHNAESPKSPKFSNEQFPLFVTWKLGKDKKLRGCIGTFNSTSLHQGLREYAITSACKDSRFDPIGTDEFARLHCSVSLLMDFEVAEHYLDWEIGVHGIRIEFSSEKGSKKAATYLPEVAVEQGWSKIQTIDSLMRKGGFKGNITAEVRATLCLVRFQSEKITVSYQEYVAHKQQASQIYVKDGSKLIPNEDGDALIDCCLISGKSAFPGHHRNHYGLASVHASSSSSGLSNGLSATGGEHHYHTSSSSGCCSHSLYHHLPSGDDGRRSPTTQKDSHHPSANAARYLPGPNHPYMPPHPPSGN